MMRRFWILTFASALSKIGNSFLYVAVPWAVLRSTKSPFLAILTLGIQSAPYVVSPLVGSLIDKYDRRRLFVVSELFQALCVMVIPWMLVSGWTAGVFICLLLVGLGAVSSSLTSDYGLIPSLVPPEQIDWAYSRNTAVLQVARLAGPAIAGVTIATLGDSLALWLDASTFLLTAGAALVFLPAVASRKPAKRVMALMQEGVQAFGQRPDIKHLTAALAVYNLGAGSLFGAVMTVASVRWSWTAEQVGLMLSVSAAATALGAWLTAYLLSSQSVERRIAFWIALCVVGGTLLLCYAPALVLTGYGLISFGEGGMNVTTMSYRQKVVDSEFAGRINAIIRMFVMGAIPVSSVLLGSMNKAAEGVTARLQFLPVTAAALLALGIWCRWLFRQRRAQAAKANPDVGVV